MPRAGPRIVGKASLAAAAPIVRSAVVSEDGLYRYGLSRVWGDMTKRIVFVMLNPSTADAVNDDATIRRCVNFARGWDYGRMDVVNLFALRTKHPAILLETEQSLRVGPANDAAIQDAVRGAHVVAAWGVHGKLDGRADAVTKLIVPLAARLDCMKLTDYGQPAHPLYLAANTQRRPFPAL